MTNKKNLAPVTVVLICLLAGNSIFPFFGFLERVSISYLFLVLIIILFINIRVDAGLLSLKVAAFFLYLAGFFIYHYSFQMGPYFYQLFGLFSWILVVDRLSHFFRRCPKRFIETIATCGFCAAVVALIQQLGSIFEIGALRDMSYLFNGMAEIEQVGPFIRAPSFFTEPGYFAVIVVPSTFFYYASKGVTSLRFVVCLLGLFSTFSTIALIGFIAVLLIYSLLVNVKKFILNIIVLMSALVIFYQLEPVKVRLTHLVMLFDNGLSPHANISVLLRFFHLEIWWSYVSENWFFGLGLGGVGEYALEVFQERIAYGDSIGDMLLALGREAAGLRDLGNMFFRVSAELGLFTFGVMLYYVGKRLFMFARHSPVEAVFLVGMLITYSMRTGQIVRLEFALIVYLIYLLGKTPVRRSFGARGERFE